MHSDNNYLDSVIVNIYNLLYYLYTYLSSIKILSKYNIYRKIREL